MTMAKRAAVLCGLMVVLLILLGVSCKSPPKKENKPPEPVPPQKTVRVEVPVSAMPLTNRILERIKNIKDLDITKFQLLLFGRITLEREYSSKDDSRQDNGTGSWTGSFKDVHIKEVLTIDDKTEGVAQSPPRDEGGETILRVCFEEGEAYLEFSSKMGEPDGLFYFKFKNDTRDKVDYRGKDGENEYTVKYTEDKVPSLLIKLTQSDVDQINPRTLTGRKVER